MNLRPWTVYVFLGVLFAFLELLAAFIDVGAAVAVAAAIGILASYLPSLFHVQQERWWPAPVLAVSAALVGTSLRLVSHRAVSPWIACAPPLAFLTSLGATLFRRRVAKRCGLCNRRLAGDLALECPRCGLVVCDQTCWDFDHCRCRLCESNRVPIFTPDSRWWDKQLGPRVDYGRCQVCLAPAAEANLRACRKCGRAQCTACWDYGNGQCAHCGWAIPDLPAALKMYIPGK